MSHPDVDSQAPTSAYRTEMHRSAPRKRVLLTCILWLSLAFGGYYGIDWALAQGAGHCLNVAADYQVCLDRRADDPA